MRYNISLSWLDLKRVQYTVEPAEKCKIEDAIAGKGAEFTPGWLNDEVKMKQIKQKRNYRFDMLTNLFYIPKVMNFYFALLEDVASHDQSVSVC